MLTIEFHTGNSAFEDNEPEETAKLLRDIASKIDRGDTDGPVLDLNGNTIGGWEFDAEQEPDSHEEE